MRGFRSRHVILLLNGIPFNSTYDGQFNPSIIPLESVAKIKASYGNHSVLYGQGGLGGVINIVTRKGEKGLQGELLGEVGEKDRYLGQFSLAGGRDLVDFFLSASGLSERGFEMSDGFDPTPLENGDLRENSDRERINVFANVGLEPTEKWGVGLVFNYLQGEFGKPPITVDKSMDPDFGKSPKFERVDSYEGYSGQFSMDYDLTDRIGLRGWAVVNRLDEELNRYDDDGYDEISKRGSFERDDETTITGGTLQTSCDLKSAGVFTVGLGYENQDYEAAGRSVGRNGLEPIDIDRDVHLCSSSVEYEVTPIERLGLVLGYGHYWFEKDDGEHDDAGSFLAGAHYDILKNTRIRGSVARKIRFPSIRQLYEPESGDPDLTTEESMNYELGVEQGLPCKSRVALVGFFEDVDDYIEKLPPDDRFKNNDEYRFFGFELTAETRFQENLFLRFGYTYLDTEDRSSGSERTDLQYRPRHKVAFEGRYLFDFGLSLYVNVLHVARQYDYSNTTPLQKRRMDDYSVVDLKVDQTVIPDRLTVYFVANNLFDEDYEESFGFPRPGRTVYGGIEWRF
jgi:outer membrane receptor protein involved in Fe transport